MECDCFLIIKIPLKAVGQGQRNGMHHVVAFFHKAKWTKRAITYEIKGVLRESTISYLTVGKYLQMFALLMKETNTHIVPESEGGFTLEDLIALVLSVEPLLLIRPLLGR
jgi:hypothetical protein